MSSVIASARTSTASVFDVVTTVANATTKLIGTGVKAIDMLDAKAQALHESVIVDTQLTREIHLDELVFTRALQHVELLEETHRRVHGTASKFDRIDQFNKSVERLTAAVTGES